VLDAPTINTEMPMTLKQYIPTRIIAASERDNLERFAGLL
jgi:hypothetical protein